MELREDQMKYRLHLISFLLIPVLIVFLPAIALGHDVSAMNTDKYKIIDRKLSVGIAVGYERFDTSYKYTDKSTGRSFFIDGEGTLGLPQNQLMPMLYGYWKPGKRHGLGFSYFQIHRVSSHSVVDKEFGDLNVTGSVSLTDRSKFYYLSYNFTAYQDDRAMVFASFGLYGLDFKYKLNAQGEIRFQGESVASGEFIRQENLLVPLPMIGVDTWFAITPKWALGVKAAVVAGKYQGISGAVIETKIRVKYTFSRRLGAFAGINNFEGEIHIDDDDEKSEIN